MPDLLYWGLACLLLILVVGAVRQYRESKLLDRYEESDRYRRSVGEPDAGFGSITHDDAGPLSGTTEFETELSEIQGDLRSVSKTLHRAIEEMESAMRAASDASHAYQALPGDSHYVLPDDGRHALLGVSPQATLDDIKQAYRAKVALWHPGKLQDVDPELQQMANDRLAEINAAYESLRSERV
jgi:hypothetical protein